MVLREAMVEVEVMPELLEVLCRCAELPSPDGVAEHQEGEEETEDGDAELPQVPLQLLGFHWGQPSPHGCW